MEPIYKNKKGMGIGDIYPAVLAIGLSGLIIGIVLYVLGQFQLQIGNSSTPQWNAINTTITGLSTFPAWIPILVTVIALSIVLTVVISSFAGQGGRR
jgi:type II secretory pathway component PulF